MLGERIGRWTIEKPIGQGGMGNVYLARSDEGELAAVKFLHAPLARQPGFVERFEREIKALQVLRHENIVGFHAAGVHRGQPYYVMEHVQGQSLADLLAERGPLPWEEVVQIGMQICNALQTAHLREIIHRDLKPANLLRGADGTVKLADFGVAKLFSEAKMTLPDTLVGTPDYVAPEQATGRPVTKRSDLYALGVVLYQLLTGRLPFLAENTAEVVHQHRYAQFDPPSKLVKDLPHELDTLLAELLAKEPEKRPGSAAIVADTLGRLQRKMQRKRQYTVVASQGPTKVDRSAAAEQASAKGGPRDFPEIPAMESTPWAKVAMLSGLLILILALLFWGLQPPPPEKLLEQAEQQAQAGNWSDAQATLDRLNKTHADHAFAAEAKKLAEQIAAGRGASRARREAGALAVTAPSCEAERLYRKGVVLYLEGRAGEAEATWANLIRAFHGLPSQEAWVKVAELALAEAKKPASTLSAAKEVLDQAAKEPPAEARNRLRSLKELYQPAAAEPEVKAILQQIDERLAKLGS